MNPHFRRVAQICFQNAVIVADRYHVVRQVYWAMERVRKTEQTKLSKRLRKYFKKSRSLLSKSIEKLTEEEMNRLSLMSQARWRLPTQKRVPFCDPHKVLCWQKTEAVRLVTICWDNGSVWILWLHKSISQLVSRDPQFYGCTLVKWFYWGLQQQDKSIEAGLFRYA